MPYPRVLCERPTITLIRLGLLWWVPPWGARSGQWILQREQHSWPVMNQWRFMASGWTWTEVGPPPPSLRDDHRTSRVWVAQAVERWAVFTDGEGAGTVSRDD